MFEKTAMRLLIELINQNNSMEEIMNLGKQSTKFAQCTRAIITLVLFFWIQMDAYSQIVHNEVSDSLPAFDHTNVNLMLDDDLVAKHPDSDIIGWAPEPTPPPWTPAGPPRPSDNAKGSLNIGVIHEELRRIYDVCVENSNDAFNGIAPEPGDDTHDHLSGGYELKTREDWRCGGYRMGINANYDNILRSRCNSVTMEFEKRCVLHEHERVEEENYFKCENEKEWFVKLPNYFYYNLVLNETLNISRNLYQTAEIRVYCDREGGWEPSFFEGLTGWFSTIQAKTGHIKVVQLAPFNRFGGPGFIERNVPTLEARVLKGIRRQYTGTDRNLVAKMRHIIDLEGLSGCECSSLGIDGDNSVPLADRNIVWDIPHPEPVLTDQ